MGLVSFKTELVEKWFRDDNRLMERERHHEKELD